MNSELMNAILAMDSNYGDTYDIPQKEQKGEPGGPSPIAREHTTPPKPNAAPMYLAQRHEGTKMGRLVLTALSSTPRHPIPRHLTPRHPELVSGSYYFDVGSKILKQVQDDEQGHEESVLELREPRRQCAKLLLSMASHCASPRELSTANPRNTPLHFVGENMLDKQEQIVNKGSNAAHAGPA